MQCLARDPRQAPERFLAPITQHLHHSRQYGLDRPLTKRPSGPPRISERSSRSRSIPFAGVSVALLRRSLPAIGHADPHPRLSRVHANRISEFFLFERFGLTSDGMSKRPHLNRFHCDHRESAPSSSPHRPGHDQHQGVRAGPGWPGCRRHSLATPIAYPRPGSGSNRRAMISGARRRRRLTAPLGIAAPATIAAIGISNQRETVLVWQRSTGGLSAPA